jgi:hypothetical protein
MVDLQAKLRRQDYSSAVKALEKLEAAKVEAANAACTSTDRTTPRTSLRPQREPAYFDSNACSASTRSWKPISPAARRGLPICAFATQLAVFVVQLAKRRLG